MSLGALVLIHGLICGLVGWLASDVAHARPEAVVRKVDEEREDDPDDR